MAERTPTRLILVIASQCGTDPTVPELDFIPPLSWQPGDPLTPTNRLPLDLYQEFQQPESGACAPVPGLADIASSHLFEPDSSLLINPGQTVAANAVEHAFATAADNGQVLIVHFIGHGDLVRLSEADPVSHRLFLSDSSPDHRAWNPYADAEPLIKEHQLPGFVFLVDACHASRARPDVSRWGTSPTTYIWMGASQDTEAFDGCFSSTLLTTMRDGDTRQGGLRPAPELHSRHIRHIVDQTCLRPTENKYPEADDLTSKADDYVFITRNRAVEAYETDLGLSGPTRDRLRAAIGEHYQVIDVDPISEAVEDHDFVVVTGGAGSGKTALAGVLRELPDELEARRLDAIAFLERRSGLDEIAQAIHPQLLKSPHYVDLLRRYERSAADLGSQGPHQRYVVGPLENLRSHYSLLVGLDGLDQLAVDRRDTVLDEYQRLVKASDGRFRVLATSRPASEGGPIPDQATIVPMPPLNPTLARRYLTAKGIEGARHDSILGLTDDPNWLVLTLAADQHLADPEAPLTATEGALYQSILDAARGSLDPGVVDPVIDVLVAAGQVAGVGPRLPFDILASAVARLGGPADIVNLNAVLAHDRLYRIIERANPSTDEDHVGLFHLTAITALAPPTERLEAAHRAIVGVLDDDLGAAG